MKVLNNIKHYTPFKGSVMFILNYFLCTCVFSQVNLVRNGTFDTLTSCPINLTKQPPLYWYQAGKKVNCLAHSCSLDAGSSTPFNSIGFQVPRSGGGYIDLAFSNLSPKARTYLQTELIDSMQQGKCYYIEFYVNLANILKYGTNNISALLTNTPFYYTDTINNPWGILAATPQITSYGNPIVIDTLNWVKISAVFTAQGGEKFFTIGNFLPDAQTQTKINNPSGVNGCTYQFDNVSVTPLDIMPLKADAGKDTSIANVGDSVFIGSLTNGISNITWYNSSGAIINTIAPGFYVKPISSTFYIVEQTVCGYTSRDTVNVTVGTVPLKFISYNLVPSLRGTKQSAENIFTTANEINVSHFNIQRSLNGKDFITIGKVVAQNKTLNNYTYNDEQTRNDKQETWFYRIESIDFDGKKQYTETKRVKLNEQQETRNIVLYPNPAKDIVNIECKDGIKEVKLFNPIGKQIATGTNLRNDGNLKLQTLNLKQVSKGLYLVKVLTNKNEINNVKLLVE